MLVIRPIKESDFESLQQCAVESGHGFTSLPVDDELLSRRITKSAEAFATPDVKTPGEESYLFVMEDTSTGEIAGCAGIEAAVGLSDAFYHYHLGKVVHHSKRHNIYNALQTLTLCNDYTGASELCTLFLREPWRKNRNGRVLSKFRMLFMAQFKERFAETVIAEMRGVSDDDGRSPFWNWLEKHFFAMDFPKADYLTGIGEKTFIAELMPKFPIYVNLLDKSAQDVIGKVHPDTLPALKLLKSEGFRFRDYVDIFDAGPTVEAEVKQLQSVRSSKLVKVSVSDSQSPQAAKGKETVYMVCNLSLDNFRACQAPLVVHTAESGSGNVTEAVMTKDVAELIEVRAGDTVRIAEL